MLKTEFIRNLNCNYERIQLDQKPEEKKYQYCILSRGGIKGLLPCSLRYIDGQAYLYYDISSTQNVAQLYDGRVISRGWMKDFLWSMRQMQVELSRFLLDDRNLLWNPDQIFQDLEKNDFNFLYVPYYDGDSGFSQLIEYWVEHIDYGDEALVEYVYKMYEQFELLGTLYLQELIFEDAVIMEQSPEELPEPKEKQPIQKAESSPSASAGIRKETEYPQINIDGAEEEKTTKKGIRYLLEGRKKKQKLERTAYQQEMKEWMNGYAVCEETVYHEEDYGKTIYLEETRNEEEIIRKLYGKDGGMAEILKSPFLIGKKKEEVDFCLPDSSVSRIHARIMMEENGVYLEDLNSTNGTFKNGLRMQPYEKKKLEPEDEIRFGKMTFIYR